MNEQLPDNQLAFAMLCNQVEVLGWRMDGLRMQLADRGFPYSLNGIYNWGKRGRSFPRRLDVIAAIIAVFVEHHPPQRRWSADQALRFALTAGQPLDRLERLADLFPIYEFEAALSVHLSRQFGLSDRRALRMAHAAIAHLPIDLVPSPAQLPAHSWGILFPHNPFFLGRDEELRRLAYMTKTVPSARVVITGVPGQGKTQLVNEFALRFGQFFAGGVFLLSADTPAQLRSQLAACGSRPAMDLAPQYEYLSEVEQLRLVHKALARDIPRLLIIDNADSRDSYDLEDLLPHQGGCRVLVTSQHQSWGAQWSVVNLAALGRSDSIRLLCALSPHLKEDDPFLDQIAALVDDLPFAIALIGAFLHSHRDEPIGTPEGLYRAITQREALSHDALNQTPGEIAPTKAQTTLDAAIALLYDGLDPYDPVSAVARELLACMAVLAPGEAIPVDWLIAGAHGQARAREEDQPRDARIALKRLKDLGMITAGTQGNIHLHRLLRSFLRTHTDLRGVVERLTESAICEMTIHEIEIEQLHSLALHLRTVAEEAVFYDLERAVEMCMGYGWYASLNGQHDDAIMWQQRALELALRLYGRVHPITAEALCRLALAHHYHSILTTAQPYYQEMISIYEQIYPSESLELAIGYQNYGNYLIVKGDYLMGEQYVRRALSIRRRLYRVNQDDVVLHQDIARCLRSLGFLFWITGQYRRARWYTWLALRIFLQDADHLRIAVAQTYSNLGAIRTLQGDYVQAKVFQEQALAIRRALHENRTDHTGRIWHQDIAEVYTRFAGLALIQGALPEAEQLLREAHAIDAVVLGEDHYETGIIVEQLGELALLRGQLDEAHQAFEKAHYIYYTMFQTEECLALAQLRYHRARLALAQRSLANARANLETARAIYTKLLPSTHPMEGWIVLLLSEVAHHEGRSDEAEGLYQYACNLLQRTIPYHPVVRHLCRTGERPSDAVNTLAL